MKYVMDRDTKEVIMIDENVERDWMRKFLHRSGIEFNPSEATKQENVGGEGLDELRSLYEAKFWKEVPVNKKNDMSWIKEKIEMSTDSL